MWTPTAIFGFGLIGQTVWQFLPAVFELFKNIVNRKSWGPKSAKGGIGSRKYVIVLLSIGLLMGVAMTRHFLFYVNHYFLTIESNQSRYDWYIDPSQSDRLASLIQPGETVLYDNLTTMLIFFSKGGIHYNTVLSPLVINSVEEKSWLKENASISYIVTRNPVNNLLGTSRGAIGLQNGTHIVLKGEIGSPINELGLFIRNEGETDTLTVIYAVLGKESELRFLQIDLPAGFSGWISPASLQEDIAWIELYLANPEVAVTLDGIRTGGNEELSWPWDKGITIERFSSDNPEISESISFSTEQLFPFSYNSLTVLHDYGSTVLSRLVR